MDAGNLIYLVAVIIYFIYTALKKNKNQGEFEEPTQPSGQENQRKPVSFEDLLKEIRQGQAQREREINQPDLSREEQRRPQRRERPPLVTAAEDVPQAKKPKRYQNFEGVVEERDAPERVKLADRELLAAEVTGIKSTISPEEVKPPAAQNRFRKLLLNPSSVRDAVILSEVLGKRYP